jgi:hypothetical protein
MTWFIEQLLCYYVCGIRIKIFLGPPKTVNQSTRWEQNHYSSSESILYGGLKIINSSKLVEVHSNLIRICNYLPNPKLGLKRGSHMPCLGTSNELRCRETKNGSESRWQHQAGGAIQSSNSRPTQTQAGSAVRRAAVGSYARWKPTHIGFYPRLAVPCAERQPAGTPGKMSLPNLDDAAGPFKFG